MKKHRHALRDIALVDRYTSRYGNKQSRSRKSNDGSRKSGSVNESISDDDDDLFSSSRSDYGDNFPSIFDALSVVGKPKTKHGARSKSTQSKSSKRTSQSTLAVATAGQQQVREQHKRPHVPTAHFGKFGSDQQVTHTIATNNRDFTDDLTVQDPPSKRTRRNVEPPQVLHRRTKLFCFLLDCCSIRKTRCAANDSRQQLSYR